jgi:hypothetical protein
LNAEVIPEEVTMAHFMYAADIVGRTMPGAEVGGVALVTLIACQRHPDWATRILAAHTAAAQRDEDPAGLEDELQESIATMLLASPP